jgi:hypothetical protein
MHISAYIKSCNITTCFWRNYVIHILSNGKTLIQLTEDDVLSSVVAPVGFRLPDGVVKEAIDMWCRNRPDMRVDEFLEKLFG